MATQDKRLSFFLQHHFVLFYLEHELHSADKREKEAISGRRKRTRSERNGDEDGARELLHHHESERHKESAPKYCQSYFWSLRRKERMGEEKITTKEGNRDHHHTNSFP